MWRWHYEERIDAMITQIRGSLVAVSGLHLVLARQRVEGGACDMHPSRLATRLHVIGQRHIVGPHIELPLAQPQHAAEHASGVNAHAHVQNDIGGLHHSAVRSEREVDQWSSTLRLDIEESSNFIR